MICSILVLNSKAFNSVAFLLYAQTITVDPLAFHVYQSPRLITFFRLIVDFIVVDLSFAMAFLMFARCCHVLTLVMVLAVVPHTHALLTCQGDFISVMNQYPDQLSSLVQFINQAGLTEKITNTNGNNTFVAPNNNAFNAFTATLQQDNFTLANLTDKNNNRAASILLYHIIPGIGSVDFNNLESGPTVPTMLEGHNLAISKAANNTVTFIGAANNATLQKASPGEISVCTSLIYIVDSVLLPNATLTSIPVTSGASAFALASAGRWAFALSSALAAALLFLN